jgi:Spy/CpxP family protein refolding chaperone
MTTFRFTLLLGAVLALPMTATAQMSGMIPWWDRPIARDLGLSDEQNRQIRDVVRESRTRLIQLRGAVESAEADLKDVMNEEKVDSPKAEAEIEKVVAARAELTRAVSLMSLKLRMTLTAAQWQELQKRQGRPAAGPGMRRPGRGGALRPSGGPANPD